MSTYYERNREKVKAKALTYRSSPRGQEKRKARELKASEYVFQYLIKHPCECGESDPVCLQFHHRDPTEKEDEVTALIHSDKAGKNLEKLIAEIAKCDVLCANCHIKLHAKEKKTFKYERALVTL